MIPAAPSPHDALLARCEATYDAADSVDEDFEHHNNDLARQYHRAVVAEWGDLSEDDALADPERFAAYVEALEAAVWQAGEDYAESGPCRSWGASPWTSEPFARAVLGL